ncbi:hypothetical protein MFIFM68171_00151 [Madurella fahalii]|uniref:Uncharacterized protein n=1 Tax=Madurella fahalii TaxID=1157608 RepID=A0ABQ0FWQ5_9PEZI
MATAAANVAVRERRRRSTPVDLERMEIMKALTAAEHSRRQFILNFAASRDTRLLIPGQKSNAVKAAEEWVADWFARNAMESANSEYFKYMVDARLWTAHVGDELDFPFAFMRGKPEESLSSSSSHETGPDRPKSEAFLVEQSIQKGGVDLSPPVAVMALPRTSSTPPHPSGKPSKRRRSIKTVETADKSSEKRRSLSWTAVEELKVPKLGRDKFPFLVRFGRWSR